MDNETMILGIIFGAGLASLLGLYALGSVEERDDLYSARTKVVLTFLVLFVSVLLGSFLIGVFGSMNLFDFLGG
jgi:uncharacterized membrane protein SpoIIM required for sporulation